MLETLRERLLSVQQDLTSGLKTLGDKSREAKISKQRAVQYLPKFSAGLELLSRYEDAWAALHKGAKECAKAGELVDSEVVMLSAHWEKKRSSLIELQEQLQQVPGFLADLESMTANLVFLVFRTESFSVASVSLHSGYSPFPGGGCPNMCSEHRTVPQEELFRILCFQMTHMTEDRSPFVAEPLQDL